MPLHHSKDPNQLFREIEQFKRDIPRIAGVEAVNFFKNSFRNQGWTDRSLEAWKPRKKLSNRRSDNRAILVKSGALKRSIRVDRYRGGKNSGAVTIVSEMPYAKIHNEGGTIKGNALIKPHIRRSRRGKSNVKSHNRRINIMISKRKFMGQSATLDDIIINSLERRLRQIIS
jgi:phage gpG-like protein